MRSRHAWWLLLLPIAAACAQKASDRALVSKLRVLAIRAEPPEPRPGDTVAIDTLFGDPTGAGRAITAVWGLCTPDAVKGVSSCAEAGRTVPVGAGTALTIVIDAHTLDPIPPDHRDQGIDLFLVVQAQAPAAGDTPAEDSTAFKRIRVSTNPVPNRNPHIVQFGVGGTGSGPYAVAKGSVTQLEVAVTPGSFESYVNSLGETKTEDLKFTWLISAGELDDAITFADPDGGARNHFIAIGDAPPATLWIVVRDPRGGAVWARRDIIAAP